jgi:hypothetical protein
MGRPPALERQQRQRQQGQLQLQLVPLLAVLLLSKVTIVVARSPSLPLLALNLLLGCVFEGSFAALLLSSVACLGARVDAGGHRCCRGRCQLGALRFLLLPLLQVLVVADHIYSSLVGSPLRLRLVYFFVCNFVSDYVQQILALYVGVGVPALVVALLATMVMVNHLLLMAVACCSRRFATPALATLLGSHTVLCLAARADGRRSAHSDGAGAGAGARVACAAGVVLLALTTYAEGLPRGRGVRYAACGNAFSRGTVECGQLLAQRARSTGLWWGRDGGGGGSSSSAAAVTMWDSPQLTLRRPAPGSRHRNVVVVGLETARASAYSPWAAAAAAASRGATYPQLGAAHTPFMESLAQRGRLVRCDMLCQRSPEASHRAACAWSIAAHGVP